MHDESSTFRFEIAGAISDIHKLSSWVGGVVFSFEIKHTGLTMHNRSLRSVSDLSTPIKKNWIEDHKQRLSYSTSYKAGELSSKRFYFGKIPKAIKRQAQTCPHSKS